MSKPLTFPFKGPLNAAAEARKIAGGLLRSKVFSKGVSLVSRGRVEALGIGSESSVLVQSGMQRCKLSTAPVSS